MPDPKAHDQMWHQLSKEEREKIKDVILKLVPNPDSDGEPDFTRPRKRAKPSGLGGKR